MYILLYRLQAILAVIKMSTNAVQLAPASTNRRPLLLMKIMMMMLMPCITRADPQMCSSPTCTCYGTELIDCRGQGRTSVPRFQPGNVTYDKLLLSANLIQHIGASAFRGIRFRKLEIIDNPLRFVNQAAFAGLESTLTEVVLNLNRAWAEFPDKALRTLVNLTTLRVADYANSSLPTGALRGLRTLRELRLTPGSLETLTAADLVDQRRSLEILDISNNKLRHFPTDAIRMLTALKVLNARANDIDHLGEGSVVSSSLEELDISHHALNRAGINSSAFVGVASTLRRLMISQCHLEDRHIPAITHAAAVTELVVSFNHITSVRTFLSNMRNLERLDAQNNSVDVLTTATLPATRRLRALNLAYNPLRNVQPDAFVELRRLEDLKLDFARAVMPLDRSSFASQRSTLRNLSLRGVDLSGLQWSVIGGLERLETLSLSRCGLGDIPPFTFRSSGGRLHTLELAGNHIDELNQTALIGLESSLVRLNLDSNRLTTIDRCTFHRFTRLDPKSLILRNNLLACDCRLRWLYNWTNGSRFFLNWNCADGRPFSRLTDADFRHCNDSEDDQPCEDFTLTTPSTPVRPLISLSVLNVTSSSFAVRWTLDSSVSAAGFRVNCSCSESWWTVGPAVREHCFGGLSGGTTYRVCVTLDGNWTEEAISCTNVSTTAWLRLRDPIIMSALIGGGVLVLLVLPLSLAVAMSVRRWRRRRRMVLAELAQPKIAAGKTKRFMRQQQRTQSLDALNSDRLDGRRFQSRSVETNLDTLQDDDDDRYRTLLALRLLQSRNARSLDNLVDGVNAAPSYFMNQLYGCHNNVEQEVYDEINETEVISPLSTNDTNL